MNCSTVRHSALFITLLKIALLSASLTTLSTPAKAENLSLVYALTQATQNNDNNTINLDTLTWLSFMSERLKKRIPDPFYRVRLLSTVLTEAKVNSLDPQLVLAVMEFESNFNRYATSRAGAQGLMQIMPFWKNVYQSPKDDLYNPLTSIRYGCRILRHYIDRYSNLSDALAAYNGSLGRKKYPKKVFASLSKRWKFTQDPFSKLQTTNIASSETQSAPIN